MNDQDDPQSHGRVNVLTALGVLVVLFVVGVAWWRLGPKAPGVQGGHAVLSGTDSGPRPGYAGTTSCERCHADQAEAWRRSDHARAMLEPADFEGDFEQVLVHGGERVEFAQDADGITVTITAESGPARTLPLVYALGVDPLQQYLARQADGRLQTLPWAWDTRSAEEGGGGWFHLLPDEALEPGDPLHWTGYLQTANHQCVECHVTGFQQGYRSQEDTFETDWRELGVACEACHPAGNQHAGEPATHGIQSLKRAEGTWARVPGQATARWEGGARTPAVMDACWSCHALRTRFEESSLADGSGKPQVFLDRNFPRLLDADAYHADGQILGEVFEFGSFTQSKMFHQGVVCADCHEPHSLELRAEGNALCAQCHDPAVFDVETHHHHSLETSGAQCVSCHMPAKTFMRIDARRDHRLGVPRPDLAEALGTPDGCAGCHDGQEAGWAAGHAQTWWPELAARPTFAPALTAGRRGDVDAEQQLIALITDTRQPAIARATALTALPGLTRLAHLEAVVAAVGDDEPLVRVGALRALSFLPLERRWEVAAPALSDPFRAVRQEAGRALLGFPREQLPQDSQQPLWQAQGLLERAERANASRPENLLNMANHQLLDGRPQEAEASLRRALELDPRSTLARVNLADVLRVLQREDEAERLLREAVEADPTAAAAEHALGLLLIRKGEKEEARSHLRRAVELDPDSHQFVYVLSVALQDAGQKLEALGVLSAAYQRRSDVGTLGALVEAARDAGDLDSARRYAAELVQRLPDSSRAKALLESLSR